MKVGFSIMASRQREGWAKELSKQLNNCPISIIDHNRFNLSHIWENCRASWKLIDKSNDYGVVIQDDAVLCKGFIKKAKSVLKKANGMAVQFYAGNDPQMEELFKANLDKGFLIKDLYWGVAIALPTSLIDEMIAFGDKHPSWQDDNKIREFLISKKIQVYYPLPCLVDHRQENENKSLLGTKSNRHSNFYED